MNLNDVQFGVTVADVPSEGQTQRYSTKVLMGTFAKWTRTTDLPLDQDGGQAGDS